MERYLYLQRLLNHYWRQWKQEYLYHLTVRSKRQTETAPIQVADIVLVSEDSISRKKRPLRRVEEIHLSKDGLVRTVIVRVQKSIITRPVQRLHRLEIESAAQKPVIKKKFLSMVGRSCSQMLFPLREFLFLNLDSVLSCPMEDKVGRMLQPVSPDLEG